MNILNKIKKTFFFLILITVTISCKDKVRDTRDKNTKFVFSAELVVEKDDDLILYYRDGTNEWFDEQHSIWVHVKGSKRVQRVKFSLPYGVLPNHLRFDFSKNPEQNPVKILNIRINYLKNSFEIKESEILNYFDTNECIIFDANKKVYKPIKNSKGIYDPYLLINEKFYTEMDKVIMGN